MVFEKPNNFEKNYDNDTLTDVSDSISKIAIEESYLRIIDFPEEENVESEIARRDKKKIRLTRFMQE